MFLLFPTKAGEQLKKAAQHSAGKAGCCAFFGLLLPPRSPCAGRPRVSAACSGQKRKM